MLEMSSQKSENNEGTLKNITKKCYTIDFQNIKLENGDYCIVSHFKDLKNIYLCKAVKGSTNDSYDVHNAKIIFETMMSKGMFYNKAHNYLLE